jgi:hypothetical protein
MSSIPADRITELVRRTREEQGLPPSVTDPAVLDRAAGLLQPWLAEQPPVASAACEEPGHAA